MKRTIAAFAITLGLVACGGGEDDAGSPADPTGGEPANEEPADQEPGDEPAGDEPGDEPAGDEPAGESVDSLDDIPERCRDLMADFLRDIEPIVETVDWDNATLADFEQVAGEFEERSNEFDTESGAEDCDDLEFTDDDDGFALIVELADDVAPGTVPFFEFLDVMRAGVSPTGGDDDGQTAADQWEDCGDAIAGIEQLMTEHDAFTEVPLDELAKFASMGSVMTSCTPEQLEFFDSPEVTDFLSR